MYVDPIEDPPPRFRLPVHLHPPVVLKREAETAPAPVKKFICPILLLFPNSTPPFFDLSLTKIPFAPKVLASSSG
jgi:hypothetical protein